MLSPSCISIQTTLSSMVLKAYRNTRNHPDSLCSFDTRGLGCRAQAARPQGGPWRHQDGARSAESAMPALRCHAGARRASKLGKWRSEIGSRDRSSSAQERQNLQIGNRKSEVEIGDPWPKRKPEPEQGATAQNRRSQSQPGALPTLAICDRNLYVHTLPKAQHRR